MRPHIAQGDHAAPRVLRHASAGARGL